MAQCRNPLFHQSTQYHMVLRWKTREERGRAQCGNPLFHQSTQYRLVLRWKTCEERSRAQCGNPLFHQSAQYHFVLRWKTREERGGAQCGNPLFHQSTHSTAWCSDGKLVRKEAGFRAQCRTLCSTSQHTVPHGAQMENS